MYARRPMRYAVVVPVKAFALAKARLAPALDAEARAALARRMAEQVLRAAGDLPVTVTCDDDDVAAWARASGAAVAWTPGTDLNGAVTAAVEQLEAGGVDRVIVAHADLPRATDLTVVAGRGGAVLVPDRQRDGTNVLAVPAGSGFRFAYGPGSFERHRAEAVRLHLEVTVLEPDDLTLDIDDPGDLDHLCG